jgi:WD40 repeat protein
LDSEVDVVKTLYNFDGPIYVSVTDGDTLYLGGYFSQVGLKDGTGTSTRRSVAAIDLTTYELTDFDADIGLEGDMGTAHALALSPDNSTLYIGGQFQCINGIFFEDNCTSFERNNLAAVDAVTGAVVVGFDPNMTGDVYDLDILSDGSALFVGGSFEDWDVAQVDYLAKIDPDTGADLGFTIDQPERVAGIFDMVLSPNEELIYVVGSTIFSIQTDDGVIFEDLEPTFNDAALVIEVSSDGETVYVGGEFSELVGQAQAVGEGTTFNSTTGLADESFPEISTGEGGGGGGGATVYAAIPDGAGGWYVSGSFSDVDVVSQDYLVHILSDNSVDMSFLPDFGIPEQRVTALALSPDGDALYVGGNFTDVEGETRNRIAALDTSDGSLLPFDPDVDGPVNAIAVSSDGGTVYAGGEFAGVNGGGTTRNALASFASTTGEVTGGFDPNISGAVSALSISPDDGTVYAGGSFTQVNGSEDYPYLAAFDVDDGAVIAGFDPDTGSAVLTMDLSPTGAVLYAGTQNNGLAGFDVTNGGAWFGISADSSISSVSLMGDGNTLYAVGDFTSFGGEPYRKFAAVALVGETSAEVLDLDVNFHSDTTAVYVVAAGTGEFFIGGEPISIEGPGGGVREGLLALDADDLTLLPFNPEFTEIDHDNDEGVHSLALSSDDELLYVGGRFEGSGPDGRSYLAAIATVDASVNSFEPILTPYSLYALTLSPEDDELYAGGSDTEGSGLFAIYSADGDVEPDPETLTVSKDGTGSGTVSSAPAGINCGGDCTEDFAADTVVTLTATATDGSEFTGWSGSGCSGTGVCIVTMSEARSVTATFDLEEDPGDDDDEDEESEDEDNGGGRSGTHRKPIINDPFHGDTNLLYQLQLKLIELLKQLLQELIKAQAGTL